MSVYWELYLEFATPPTDDIVCRRCGQRIDRDSVCASSGIFTTISLGRGESKHLHNACAVDLDAEAMVRLLVRDPLEFVGRSQLDALARARAAAITAANKRAKKGQTAEPLATERARDLRGRPRVRVLFSGSHTAGSHHVGVEALFIDQTFCSSKHEFVLVRHTSMRSLRIDPSQPWVASMFWQSANEGIATSRRAQLVEWAALGLPAPLLVVTGGDSHHKRDELVLSLRKMAARAGYDPDECPALTATSPDPAFIEALGIALEERAELAMDSGAPLDRDARIIEQLEAVLEKGNVEAIVPAVKKAARTVGRARVADKQRVIDAMVRAAAVQGASSAVVKEALAFTASQLDPAWLVALARVLLTAEIPFSTVFDDLCARWQALASEREALPALLVETIEREPPSSARARRAAYWHARLKTAASAAALRALLAKSAKQRARRALIEAALAKP